MSTISFMHLLPVSRSWRYLPKSFEERKERKEAEEKEEKERKKRKAKFFVANKSSREWIHQTKAAKPPNDGRKPRVGGEERWEGRRRRLENPKVASLCFTKALPLHSQRKPIIKYAA